MNQIRFLALAGLLSLATATHADWIPATTTDRAKTDSLERFLVLRDSEVETRFGEQIIPMGDINSDGQADVLVVRTWGDVYEPWPSFLYYGGFPPDSVADSVYWSFQLWPGPVGDINNDGFCDIAQTVAPWHNLELFFGGPLLDDSVDFEIPNVWSRITPAVDLDADGGLDLPVSTWVNGGPVHIYRIDSLRDTIPEYIISDTSEGFGRNIATGEFNGDAYSDLVIAMYWNRDTCLAKFYWGGPDFDTVPDLVIKNAGPAFGEQLVPLGDFNGDGFGDIFIGGRYDGLPMGIFFGGPEVDGELDVVTNGGHSGNSYDGVTCADLAGDINADGYQDLVIGYTLDPNAYWNVLKVYLGGPDVDYFMVPDIFINGIDIPGVQAFMSLEVAGIGDFNGDGIDDFAASSRTSGGGPNWYAEVNLFAGYDPYGLNAPDDHEPTQPDGYHLSHNYPNPFNPSTTIVFTLPSRCEASLTVYDIMGRPVRVLINKVLARGDYQVSWDGCNEMDQSVASGVYLYRLVANEYTESRKMMLVK